jgi:signal transduction histidine kinase
MRSIFVKILLGFVGIVVLSVGAALFLFRTGDRDRQPQPFIERLLAYQCAQAQQALMLGGTDGLRTEIGELDATFLARHTLLDAAGRDVLTGVDRAVDIAKVKPPSRVPGTGGDFLAVGSCPDPKHQLLVAGTMGGPFAVTWTRIAGIAAGIGGLCYLLALQLALPLRRLRHVVDRFGRGDLQARSGSRRGDEIGDLSRAFDQMAARIALLVGAERRLLQDVSHELRSPLARLRFAIELAHTAEDRQRALARIRGEVDRLAGLVDGLLQVTRLEGDPGSGVVAKDVPIDEVVGRVIEDCRLEADARSVELSFRQPSPMVVKGDAELLRRAAENVVRNAIAHAPPGTAVEVDLQCGPDGMGIAIRDYGPGVPDDMLTRIFQPFFRVETDRNRTAGGVGLGLAIAQRAMDVHGGRIAARNAYPGLHVELRLPA